MLPGGEGELDFGGGRPGVNARSKPFGAADVAAELEDPVAPADSGSLVAASEVSCGRAGFPRADGSNQGSAEGPDPDGPGAPCC